MSVGIGMIGCGGIGLVVLRELLKHSKKLQVRGERCIVHAPL